MDTIWDCPQTELYSFILERGGGGEREGREGEEKGRRRERGKRSRKEKKRPITVKYPSPVKSLRNTNHTNSVSRNGDFSKLPSDAQGPASCCEPGQSVLNVSLVSWRQ